MKNFFLLFFLLGSCLGFSQGFVPTDITNLKLWLAADTGITLNGPNVSAWADLSGNNNHATQGTAISQPEYIASGLGAKPMIRFGKNGLSGDETFLSFSQSISLTANNFTVIYVYKPLGVTNALHFIIANNSKGISTGGSFVDKLLIYDGGATWLETSSPYTTTGLISHTSNNIYRNGLLVPTSGTPAGNMDFSAVGTRPGFSSYFYYGFISEVLIYDKQLSLAEQTQVENYLFTKYAAPVSLGSDINSAVFCDTILNAGSRFDTYLWSTGATTPSINIDSTGTYWVEATDIFGRLSKDTINVVYPNLLYPSAGNAICAGDSVIWDTGLPNNIFDFLWQDGTTDSVYTIKTAGAYWVRITDSSGCIKYSDTLNYSVDNFSQVATLGNDISLCSGNSIYLTAGAGAGVGYVWNDLSTNDSLLITGVLGQIDTAWVTVTNSNNCVKKDTIHVTISGEAPTANFTAPNVCFGASTGFTDTSVPPTGGPITGYLWNFGDLNSSTLSNPAHVYADTGTYTVSLTVTAGACAHQLSKQVRVYPNPQVNFTSQSICLNQTNQFTTTIDSFGYNITSKSWDFGDPSSGGNNVSSLLNPLHTFANLGMYSVIVTVQNSQGCIDSIRKNVISAPANCIPTDVSNLKLWLAADSGVTLNGVNVSSWADLSGNNNHAAQGIPASQPEYVLSGIGAKPMIRFGKNGVPNVDVTDLAFPQLTLNANNFTIIYVYKPLGIPNGLHYMIGGTNKGISTGGSIASGLLIYDGGPTWLETTSPYATTGLITHTSNSIYRNGSVVPTTGTPAGNMLLNTIGTRPDFSSFYYYGNISEVLIYDKQLSATEQTQVENYLFTKYAAPVNLGADINNAVFCDTTLDAGARFVDYYWSTGDSTQTITIDSSGSYWVETTDIFGRTSTDTIQINYPVIPKPTGSTVLCIGSTKLWDTGLSKNLYDFQWQNGSIDSVFTITGAGQYWVRVTDTAGCIKYSDTLIYTVDNFSQTATLGNDVNLCSGNYIYLTAGAGPGVNYVWNDLSTNDSLQITATSGTVLCWVTATNSNGCIKQDSINVTINGIAPTANFTHTNVCFGATTAFTNGSIAPTGNTITYQWNFGEPSSGVNNTSILQNPTHTYADTGSYTVTLTVTTNVGCTQMISKVVRVYPNPVASYTSSNLCNNSYVQFAGSAINYGYPVTQWNWIFGDPSSGSNDSSILQNSVHVYLTSTNYNVQLIIENLYGCKDTSLQTILIKPSPTADFSYTTACKSSSMKFTDVSIIPSGTTVSSTGNYWNFGDNTSSTLLNPPHTYYTNITYSVLHVVALTNGCVDSVIKQVTVHPKPSAYFSNTNLCVNSVTSFNDLSIMLGGGTITGWNWTFGATGSSSQPNPQYIFSGSGPTPVKLVVTSNMGCKDSVTQSLVVNPQPVAGFTFTPNSGSPPTTVNYTNTSAGAASYLWNFGDGNQSTLLNPSNTYNDTGSYQTSLIATNNFGCTDTAYNSFLSVPRKVDVAILDFTASLQNEYLNITAQLKNKGTVDVTKMELYVEVNNGPSVKENWTGTLIKNNGTLLYQIPTSMHLIESEHYICITLADPNGVNDEFPADNYLCKALDISSFQVMNPYPVPSNDVVTLPLVIPEKDVLVITLYDARGKQVQVAYSGLIEEGLQMVNIYTVGMTSGIYACIIEYQNKKEIKKIIKY